MRLKGTAGSRFPARRRYNRRVAADLAIGSDVAGYRIEALIARGGMGVVYRATHLGLERPVALKVISHDLAGREGFRERFLRESRLAASLDHPAVVPVFDSREVDGELIVAMRLVAGGDLRRLIDNDGPLPPARALDLLGQVAAALDAAHAAGIVHRDVKPHNVLVEGDRAFLSDFGLAKALDESGTQSGASVVGTAAYMSPEQWQGGPVGPAADIYSLGCVLYETLTGVVPYGRGESDTEPEISAGMEATIERAVSRDPRERFECARDLIAAARRHQDSDARPTAVLSRGGEGATKPLGDEAPTRALPHREVRRFQKKVALWVGGGFLGLILLAILGGFIAEKIFGGDEVAVSAPIAVAKPPLRIAADAKGVWVTSQSEGTLTRLEPATGSPVGVPVHLGVGISGVAIGSRWLWVTDPPRGDLLRLSVAGRVLQRIHLGGSPGAIALGGGRVWVADQDGGGVTAVNAVGGHVYRRHLPPRVTPLRLATGAGGLWVSSASTGSVRRIDLGTLAVGEATPAGRGPAGVTVAHGYVWVANSRAGTVTRVDPALHTATPIEIAGHPGGIDAGTTTIWVADRSEGTVSRIDAASGEIVGDPIAVGPKPGAVAVGGEAVWVANNGDGTVTRIEP
jgi:DNA-binding beta-propeller fold protein YncE